MGDSVTCGNDDNNNKCDRRLVLCELVLLALARPDRNAQEYWHTGQTSQQIVQRLAGESLSMPGLDITVVLLGTNDLIQSVAQSATLRADRQAIRAIHAHGLRAVMMAILPNDLNGAGATALNAAKKPVALAEGAIWIDPWAAARSAGGTYVPGASSDGAHPRAGASRDGCRLHPR